MCTWTQISRLWKDPQQIVLVKAKPNKTVYYMPPVYTSLYRDISRGIFVMQTSDMLNIIII